jgi:hypothetical protein
MESHTGKTLVSASLEMTKRTTVAWFVVALLMGDRIPGFQISWGSAEG